ncbi:MAG: PilZ domain-containing protein [Deltaproteobacteria bacterium]|nr:PilZ domain-containing protein [Deltaproteobacteria bacterium]
MESGDKDIETPDGQYSQREFVRMSDKLPVYYELFSDHRPTADWEVMFDEIDPRPEENPKLYELLFDINQKLHMLINYMAEKNGFNMPEARDVNISGGGLKFFCNDNFKSGERLVLKLFLPTHSHVIKVKCEVVRAVPAPSGGFEVAVRYVGMDEGTRDKIIRYIFARQRRLLRGDKSPQE